MSTGLVQGGRRWRRLNQYGSEFCQCSYPTWVRGCVKDTAPTFGIEVQCLRAGDVRKGYRDNEGLMPVLLQVHESLARDVWLDC